MNLKRVIKEEIDDFQWIRNVKAYPTLQQLFDTGEINEGDLLVLRGEVENGKTGEMIWVNDFTININNKKDTLDGTTFNMGPNEEDAENAMGLSNNYNVTFLISDGNLEVIKKNNQSTQLTEEVDNNIQWIQDINPIYSGNFYIDIQDLNREEKHQIQQMILDLGFRWADGNNGILERALGDWNNGYTIHNDMGEKRLYRSTIPKEEMENFYTILDTNQFLKLINKTLK
jgi:hypothetical protein